MFSSIKNWLVSNSWKFRILSFEISCWIRWASYVLQKNLPTYLCRPGMQAGLTLGFLAQSTGVLSLNNAKSLSKVVRLPKNGCLIISRISLRNTVVSLLSVQSWSPRTTWMNLWVFLCRQWAAVRTYLALIRVPPHQGLKVRIISKLYISSQGPLKKWTEHSMILHVED